MAINSVQVIIGEQTHTLTLNLSTGCYEKTITAPSMSSYNVNNDHYYPVTVKATDTAGNTTIVNDSDSVLGSDLKLQVKEITKPAITIFSVLPCDFLFRAYSLSCFVKEYAAAGNLNLWLGKQLSLAENEMDMIVCLSLIMVQSRHTFHSVPSAKFLCKIL